MSIQVNHVSVVVGADVTVRPPADIKHTDAHHTCLFVATDNGVSRLQISGAPHALRALILRMESALTAIEAAATEAEEKEDA